MSEAVVEINLRLSDDEQLLGIFVHHPDPDGRFTLERLLIDLGADVTTYPHGAVPPGIEGTAVVANSTISVHVGPLYVIGAMDIPTDRAALAKHAVLYVTPKPFRETDRNEKQLVAATLSLEFEEGCTA